MRRRDVGGGGFNETTGKKWLAGLKPLQEAADAALAAWQAANAEQPALAAERTALESSRGALQTALTAARAALAATQAAADDARKRLDSLQAALDDASAALFGQAATDVPLVLLPVRLETRFDTGGGGRVLKIRVYPDEIHIDAHEPGLTPDESRWGANHWQSVAGAHGDAASVRAAFRQLASRFGPRRAAWVAHATDPSVLHRVVPPRDGPWTRAALARLMPGRWIAVGYVGGERAVAAVGRAIVPELAVGPSPRSDGTSAVAGEGVPAVDAGMRWMVDFGAAEAAGMGLRLALPAGSDGGLDRLVVIGIRDGADANQSTTELTALLTAKHFTQGLAFLAEGTATNNTEGGAAAATASDAETVFDLEFGPARLPIPLPPPDSRLDGHWLAWGLGIAPQTLSRVAGSDGQDVVAARTALSVLGARGDSTLVRRLGPADATRATLMQEAAAGGALPALRVGTQPYGWLVVVPDVLERGGHGAGAAVSRVTAVATEVHVRAAAGAAFADAADVAALMSQAGGGARYLSETFSGGGGGTTTRTLDLQGLRASTGPWGALPATTADGVVRDALDAVARRPDVWIGASATRRLAELRAAKPSGLRVGAFACVENLVPAGMSASALTVPGWTTPLVEATAGQGYVQAPSMTHAAAAAVLRSGFLAGSRDPTASVDLSSHRVQRAQWLLDGVRQGQSLGALLGYRFERRLQDAGLAQYIARFRTLAAIRRDDAIGLAIDAVRNAEAQRDAAAAALDRWNAADAAVQRAQAADEEAAARVARFEDVVNRANTLRNQLASAEAALAQAEAAATAHRAARPASGGQYNPQTHHVEVDNVDSDDLNAWTAAQRPLDAAARSARTARDALAHQLDALRADEDDSIRNLGPEHGPPGPARQQLAAADAAVAAARTQRGSDTPPSTAAAEAALAAARGQLRDAIVASWATALVSTAASGVADGLELFRRWRLAHAVSPTHPEWNARTIPFGDASLGFPSPKPASSDFAQFGALTGQLESLADEVDAIADIVTAEAVYQMARGNTVRATAALDVLSGSAGLPAEFDVLQTPRSGVAVVHGLFGILPAAVATPPTWPDAADCIRSRLDPGLEAYVQALVPGAAKIVCAYEIRSADGNTTIRADRLRADALGLSALEFAAAANASPGIGKDEVENELGAWIVRTLQSASDVPRDATIRLNAGARAMLATDEFPLAEAAEMAAAAYRLVSSARAIDARDVGASILVPGLDVAELAGRTAGLRTATAGVRADIAAALGAVRASADAGPQASLDTALARAFHWRIGGALPTVPVDRSTPNLKVAPSPQAMLDALLARAEAVLAEFDRRLAAFADLPVPDTANPGGAAERALAQARALLGEDAQIAPRLDATVLAGWTDAFGDSSALQGGDPLAADAWLERMAYVRDGAGRLQRALGYSGVVHPLSSSALSVGQLPRQAGDRWVALAAADPGGVARGRTSSVVHRPVPASAGASVGILLIDGWTETVPSPAETTGLAFHYDRPNATAAQVALVGVAPASRPRWTLDLVQSTVTTALTIARARSAPSDGRTEIVWFDDDLPAGAATASDYGGWQWESGSPVAFSGRRCHRTPPVGNIHQHFFFGAAQTMSVGVGETLIAHVHLDRANLPTTLMLQWHTPDGSWEHRAFWGTDTIPWGVAGSVSRHRVGALPPSNGWYRLEVPAAAVGLEGKVVDGMAFTLSGGSATWCRAGKLTDPASAVPWHAARSDLIWMRDRPPADAALHDDNDPWQWASHDPDPFAGTDGVAPALARFSHRSKAAAGMHQHYFQGTQAPWLVLPGDLLFAYVFLPVADAERPREVMLQWNDGASWEHRAFWGDDLVPFGTSGMPGRLRIETALPPAGRWIRLEVDATAVDLAGRLVSGVAFTLHDGSATWGPIGVARAALGNEIIVQ